jgi:hypothetical protein
MDRDASPTADSVRALAADLRAYMGLLRDAGMVHLAEGSVQASRIAIEAWNGVELEAEARPGGPVQGQTVPLEDARARVVAPLPDARAEAEPVDALPEAQPSEPKELERDAPDVTIVEEPPVAIVAGVAETPDGISVPVEVLREAQATAENDKPTEPEEAPPAPEVPGQGDLFAMLAEPEPRPVARGRRKKA